MKYIQQTLTIKIYIAKDDTDTSATEGIDASDRIKIYETTDDPSNGTLIATLAGAETTDDPSALGESYLFTFQKKVSTPDTYTFYYTIIDSSGNESASINTFEKVVCLTPRTPSAMTTNETTSDTVIFNIN